MFDSIPGVTLSYLSDISEEIRLKPYETLSLFGREVFEQTIFKKIVAAW